MKFFHLSDLHIGLKLYNRDLLEDQKFVLQQVVEQAKKEKPDAVVIAGDIYDKAVPSAEAVSVFDWFVLYLKKEVPDTVVMMISGNHDSAPRVNLYRGILEEQNLYMAGMPPQQPEEHIQKVTMSDEWGNVIFYLLPFVKPGYVRKLFDEEIKGYDMAVRRLIEREEIDPARRNVILSHQFYTAGGKEPATCDSEIHYVGGVENVDAGVLAPFDYAALGHIHRAQHIGAEKYRYCGTPFPYSVSEAGEEKSVTVVELGEKGQPPVIRQIPLTPVREVKKLTGTLHEILEQAGEEVCHAFVSITLTDDVEAFQPKERLEEKYDHILEIRIDNARTRKLLSDTEEQLAEVRPEEAFAMFFAEMNGREMTPEERELMRQVIAQEMEGDE